MLSLLLIALTFPFSLHNPVSSCKPRRGWWAMCPPAAAGTPLTYASMPQMSWAYSRMVRSLEKCPELAMLCRALRCQSRWSS